MWLNYLLLYLLFIDHLFLLLFTDYYVFEYFEYRLFILIIKISLSIFCMNSLDGKTEMLQCCQRYPGWCTNVGVNITIYYGFKIKTYG